MKLHLSAIAFGISLAYAAVPALADQSDVVQNGTGNGVNVEQIFNTGGTNYSNISQTGTGNAGTVLQNANTGFNSSNIAQNGTSNGGAVQQSNSDAVTASYFPRRDQQPRRYQAIDCRC